MNIALFASRFYIIVSVPILLSFSTLAAAQTIGSDQLPPSPAADGYNPPSVPYSAPTPGYRVIIPSDKPDLLVQAKTLEPTAFIQTLNGQRVIQVGLYGNESIARQQVSRFQAQGLPIMIQGAGIPTLQQQPISPSAPSPLPTLYSPNSISPTHSNPLPVVETTAKGYYVIVPTQSGEVNFVQSQLNQLGIPPQYVFLRDRPFGIHYAIGVFSQRSQAEKMAGLVRSRSNLDSRVHYER